MSLTPAITAESCMNSASARRAISRASVVLPVPGGPQRISECSWPFSSAWRSGLPGPSTCSWPTNSSSVRGRMRSASGRKRIVRRRVAQQVRLPPGRGRRALIAPARAALTPSATRSGQRATPEARHQQAQRRADAVGERRRADRPRGPTCMKYCANFDDRRRRPAGTRRSSTSARRGTRPAKYAASAAWPSKWLTLSLSSNGSGRSWPGTRQTYRGGEQQNHASVH